MLVYTKMNSAVPWYGVEFDITSSNPVFTRIASDMTLHSSLPIQSKMRRCLVLDNRTVNYYLGASNSLKKEDGVTDAVLDGVEGQFMVEIPAHHWQETFDGNICRWKFAERYIQGFTYIPKHYISAGEAVLNRTNNKLSCVVSTSADYRGGNNTSAWDGTYRSLIGKPATNITRTNYRVYTANRGAGWTLELPYQYSAWRRLCYCEYATRNIQLAVNPALTAEGYRQGGLGAGVTTANGTEWNNYNLYNPFLNIGCTASLGNASGEVSINVENFGRAGVTRTFTANSYRGIELPFGHVWKWIDGVNMWAQTVGEGDQFLLYINDNYATLADNTATNYMLSGALSRTPAYIKTMLAGQLFPSESGGTGTSTTTYWCDKWYTNAVSNFGWRAPYVGGAANNGADAGLVCVVANYAPSFANAAIGSRLCCLGA